jgi:cell division protein FtsB
MNTDTVILLLLADLQAQIVALKAENAALREQIPPPAAPALKGA